MVLGWSLRLMRYYRVEPKRAVEEQRLPVAETPKAERVKPLRSVSVPPVTEKPGPKPSPPPKPPITKPSSQIGRQAPKPSPQPEKPAALVKVGEKVAAIVQNKQGSKITVKLQASLVRRSPLNSRITPGRLGRR